MYNHKINLLQAIMFALLLPLASLAQAQEETWRLNLKDADIRAFVTQVADITGYSFVVDPRVKGKVTVLSSAPMNKDEIYDLFLAVLNVHGFTAIPGEEVVKIVQQVDAKQSAENLNRFPQTPSEQLITRVIQIDNANALELVPILRPLVAKYGHLAGVAAANALIVSDHASNIARIEQIVRELDSPSKYEVEVIQLQEAWVGDMVTLLQELAPEELGRAGGENAARKYSVTADERSNRLILRGDETFRDKMRGLILQLDQPSASGGTTKVIRLRHADEQAQGARRGPRAAATRARADAERGRDPHPDPRPAPEAERRHPAEALTRGILPRVTAREPTLSLPSPQDSLAGPCGFAAGCAVRRRGRVARELNSAGGRRLADDRRWGRCRMTSSAPPMTGRRRHPGLLGRHRSPEPESDARGVIRERARRADAHQATTSIGCVSPSATGASTVTPRMPAIRCATPPGSLYRSNECTRT